MQNALNIIVLSLSCIINVGAVIALIGTIVRKAKAPNQNQNERLDQHEKRLDQHDEILSKHKRRLDNIEEGNRFTLRSLLALLGHSIDNSDTSKLEKVKEELEDFLIRN